MIVAEPTFAGMGEISDRTTKAGPPSTALWHAVAGSSAIHNNALYF